MGVGTSLAIDDSADAVTVNRECVLYLLLEADAPIDGSGRWERAERDVRPRVRLVRRHSDTPNRVLDLEDAGIAREHQPRNP